MPLIKDPLRWKRLRYNVLLETLTDEEFGELEQKLIEHVYLPDQVIIEDEGYGSFWPRGGSGFPSGPRTANHDCWPFCIRGTASASLN
jgi:hypothetical protein